MVETTNQHFVGHTWGPVVPNPAPSIPSAVRFRAAWPTTPAMPWGACHHRRRVFFPIFPLKSVNTSTRKANPAKLGVKMEVQETKTCMTNFLCIFFDSLSWRTVWLSGWFAIEVRRDGEWYLGTESLMSWVAPCVPSDHPALCVAQEVNLKWFDEPLKKVISWHPDVQLEASSQSAYASGNHFDLWPGSASST